MDRQKEVWYIAKIARLESELRRANEDLNTMAKFLVQDVQTIRKLRQHSKLPGVPNHRWPYRGLLRRLLGI